MERIKREQNKWKKEWKESECLNSLSRCIDFSSIDRHKKWLIKTRQIFTLRRVAQRGKFIFQKKVFMLMHRNFPLLLFFFHSFFHCFFVLFPLLLFSFCSFRLPYTKLKKIVLAFSLYILLPFYCCFFASISIKVFNFLFYLFSIGFSSF